MKVYYIFKDCEKIYKHILNKSKNEYFGAFIVLFNFSCYTLSHIQLESNNRIDRWSFNRHRSLFLVCLQIQEF